jgi:K+-transporting ATPase C subunit
VVPERHDPVLMKTLRGYQHDVEVIEQIHRRQPLVFEVLRSRWKHEMTRSASGLDPDITPTNAMLQTARIAAARGISVEEVRTLLGRQTHGRAWGLFGQPAVNVLETNLALDRELPKRPPMVSPSAGDVAGPSAAQ